MKTLALTLLLALVTGFSTAFAAEATPPEKMEDAPHARDHKLHEAEELRSADAKRLREISTKAFGVKWSKKVVAVSDQGFHVLTDGVTTVSYRPTGNAYFVQTGKNGLAGLSAFQGSNGTLIERGVRVLSALAISKQEITNTKILQQYVTSGVVDREKGTASVEPPRKDRGSLLVTRSIRGLPVVSSRLLLDLDAEGKIAALELSWPRIQPRVLAEAERLRRIARADFRAPDRQGAKVESVQAVILHSPAASFIDDQVAAVRVVYAPIDSKLGKKPVLYLGANGRPVEMPRATFSKPEAMTDMRPRAVGTQSPQ